MNSEKITVQALVAADRNSVWNYYTGSEHIVNWNFADPSWHCPRATNDMRQGGKYFARMEARDGSFGFDFEAVYDEVREKEGFTYTFGGRQCSVEFKDEGAGTRVIVTFDPETENPAEMQRDGWQSILNNFKAYAEGKNK